MERAMRAARALQEQQHAFEARIGVPYEFFSKLPADAQTSILKNKGIVPDPENDPISLFGGRTMHQLMTQGIPGTPATESTLQAGPMPTPPPFEPGTVEGPRPPGLPASPGTAAIPPFSLFNPEQRGNVAASAANLELPVSPQDKALADYRNAERARIEKLTPLEAGLRTAQTGAADATAAAARALQAQRERENAPTPPALLQMAKKFGVPIDPNVPIPLWQYREATKYNKSIGAVLDRTDELTAALEQKESDSGVQFSDDEIDHFVDIAAGDVAAISGKAGIQIIKYSVKEQIKASRGGGQTPGVAPPRSGY
jgi:hypothetical protein